MFEVVRESIESLRSLVAVLDPTALNGEQAKQLVVDGAELERLAGAVRTLAAGRVAQTGAWANDGPFRDRGGVDGERGGHHGRTRQGDDRDGGAARGVARDRGCLPGRVALRGAGRRDHDRGGRGSARREDVVAVRVHRGDPWTEERVRTSGSRGVDGPGRALRDGTGPSAPAPPRPVRRGRAHRDARSDRRDRGGHGRAPADRGRALRAGATPNDAAKLPEGARVRRDEADGRRLRGGRVRRGRPPSTGDAGPAGRPRRVPPWVHRTGRGVRDRGDRARSR